MNTKTIGEKSEAAFLAKFIFLGYKVLLPFGNNQRYDLVIDRGNGFERVQIKTGNLIKGAVTTFCSSAPHSKKSKRRTYTGEIDLFGIYCPQLNTFYLVPISSIKEEQKEISLRVLPCKNKRVLKITLASDFEI